MSEDPRPIERQTPARNFTVASIETFDVLEVLARGSHDFRQAPRYGLVFGSIYAIGGWLLLALLLLLNLPFLPYPLSAGVTIIAPFIAYAFYCVSDCLERDASLTWGRVLPALRQAASQDMACMALVTGFTLFIWMDIAAFLFFGFFGLTSMPLGELINEILTTPKGILFLLIGNTAGAFITMAVFSFSVTSVPMLYYRAVNFITAMITFLWVVRKNPRSIVFFGQ